MGCKVLLDHQENVALQERKDLQDLRVEGAPTSDGVVVLALV